MSSRTEAEKMGARCNACPRRRGTPIFSESVDRTEQFRFVWLGESPGRNETRIGRPFVGATGALITKIWAEACEALGIAPIPRTYIYVTNATLCEPVDSKSESEHRTATQCCRPRLLKELSRFKQDDGFLVMGKWAVYALTGVERKISEYLGFTMQFNPALMRRLCMEQKPDAREPDEPSDDIPF